MHEPQSAQRLKANVFSLL